MENRKKLKRVFKAGFTIEASYLLPFIMFLIWNILYLSFFLYDQSTVMQGSYCTALRTERMTGNQREKAAAAEEKYDVAVRKKIVCAEIAEEKEITEGSVIIVTKLNMYSPGGYFFQSLWHGEQKQTVEKWQPVTFIRNCRKVENITDFLRAEDE